MILLNMVDTYNCNYNDYIYYYDKSDNDNDNDYDDDNYYQKSSDGTLIGAFL